MDLGYEFKAHFDLEVILFVSNDEPVLLLTLLFLHLVFCCCNGQAPRSFPQRTFAKKRFLEAFVGVWLRKQAEEFLKSSSFRVQEKTRHENDLQFQAETQRPHCRGPSLSLPQRAACSHQLCFRPLQAGSKKRKQRCRLVRGSDVSTVPVYIL